MVEGCLRILAHFDQVTIWIAHIRILSLQSVRQVISFRLLALILHLSIQPGINGHCSKLNSPALGGATIALYCPLCETHPQHLTCGSRCAFHRAANAFSQSPASTHHDDAAAIAVAEDAVVRASTFQEGDLASLTDAKYLAVTKATTRRDCLAFVAFCPSWVPTFGMMPSRSPDG